MACERKKVQSKIETLAFNPPKNPIQSFQSVQTLLKLISGSRNVKKLMRIVEKTTRESLFKSPVPTNRLTGPGPIDHLVNGFDFSSFVHFLVFWSPSPLPVIFSWNPQLFMSNVKGILIFGQNLTIYLSICLYDASDMKFMQLEGIFIKNSLSNH